MLYLHYSWTDNVYVFNLYFILKINIKFEHKSTNNIIIFKYLT